MNRSTDVDIFTRAYMKLNARGRREAILLTCIAFGAVLSLLTEFLGALHLLRPAPLLLAWCVIVIAAAYGIAKVPRSLSSLTVSGGIPDYLIVAGILGVTGVT